MTPANTPQSHLTPVVVFPPSLPPSLSLCRWGALLGGFLMSSGVLLSAWTVRSYPLFLLTYGIQFGLANGIAFPCPLACAFRWMPKRRGLASGVILSGVGLSALVLGPIQVGAFGAWDGKGERVAMDCLCCGAGCCVVWQTWYVNPDNVRPDVAPYAVHPEERYFDDPQVLDRLPKLFFWRSGTDTQHTVMRILVTSAASACVSAVSGLVYGVIQFIGACLLIDPPEPPPPPYSHRKVDPTPPPQTTVYHLSSSLFVCLAPQSACVN